MMKKLSLLASLLFFGVFFSQTDLKKTFSTAEKNMLIGSNNDFRNFWDVLHYDIKIEALFEEKMLKGSQKIRFKITKSIENPTFQIDLNENMKLSKIDSPFKISENIINGNFIFLKTKKRFKKGDVFEISMIFEGKPMIAKNAPWDGGWVFKTDKNQNPWMSAACEGVGASVWLPLKDSWQDEPDYGMTMEVIVPKNLMGIANGKLISKNLSGEKDHYTWQVKNKINTYNMIPYIGDYVHFSDTYNGLNGKLNLEYYVLRDNLEKAKPQFSQSKTMLKSFEYWFGAYPFYQDDYKLVESPYLGMEHQSNIAYGNQYKNGYLGRDLSGTGHGLLWDFIIIHESGHEWFGNSISAEDRADMWLHESFTNYSEVLFVESTQGLKNANEYCIGLRKNIRNDQPIIVEHNINAEGSGDMYYKGSNMIHTLRQIINDTTKFRAMLVEMNKVFYHKNIGTKDMVYFINNFTGLNLESVFRQYLGTTEIPKLEYKLIGNVLEYRYTNIVSGLNLPLRLESENQCLLPNENWQKITLENPKNLKFNPNYYVDYKDVNP